MAHIIELITSIAREGDGTKNNPIRQVIELYTKDGKLIAGYDTHTMESFFFGNDLPSIEAKIALQFGNKKPST